MVAPVIALCFLFYNDILIDESGSKMAVITAHSIGYWLASISTVLVENLFLQMVASNFEKTPKG